MSNKPDEFSPETRILDMRPSGSKAVGGGKLPPNFHQGGAERGPRVPQGSDTPTVIYSNNAPTEPLDDPRKTRPMQSSMPGDGVTVYHPTMNDPVVGWLVVVGGKGYGNALPIGAKQNNIGRGAKQRVRIDYGDQEISREDHCFVIYEKRTRSFTILRGTGAGITYVNNQLLLEPRPLQAGEIIQMGQTFLRFVPLCGPDFSWEQGEMSEATLFPPPAASE